MSDPTELSLEPWEQLQRIIESNNAEHLAAFLQLLPPEDTAYTISRLDEDSRTRMLSMLSSAGPALAADLMEHFIDQQVADMIEQLDPLEAAAIVDRMDSDEQTDILGELEAQDAEAILDRMEPTEAHDARRRLEYETDTAGGLMITEYLAYQQNQDVDDVIRDLRDHAASRGEFDARYLYVVDDTGRLTGLVPMRRLVMAPRGRLLMDLRTEELIKVRVDAPLDDLEDLFDRVDYSAVPALDEQDRLVGVVERAAVQEALSEQANEDLLKVGGIIAGEELRSMTLRSRTLRRLAFLVPTLFLLLASASIIALFEQTVAEVPILAAFLPVVAGLCGSGGNQAVAVSMREISLGLIKATDLWRILSKEAAVALINGALLGLAVFAVAWWEYGVGLGLVVGGAIPITIVVAGCVGGTVPVVLRGLNIDPAMASGPVVTTTVDLFSFLIVLLFATRILL